MRVSSVVSSQPIKNNSKFGISNEPKKEREIWLEADKQTKDLDDASTAALIGACLFGGHDIFSSSKKIDASGWIGLGLLIVSSALMVTSFIKRHSTYKKLKQQQNAN